MSQLSHWTRRTILLFAAVVVLTLLPLAQIHAAAGQPNIVILLADDLGYGDLGCYGHPRIKSPHLDKLATQGVRFTQFYAGGVVCSPSRAALLTGRNPIRAGINDWIPDNSPMHLKTSEATLPKLLKQAGYSTCHVGKWHLNGEFNQPTQPQPSDHGYDHWLATQNNAAPDHAGPVNFVRNGTVVPRTKEPSALFIATEAVQWLKEKRDPKKPFFLTVWSHEPHYPIKAAQKYLDQYSDVADEQLRSYLADVTQMDDGFGRVLQTLDELKLTDNTIVIFTSDNGPEGNGKTTPGRGSAGNLRGRKRSLEEGGIRVPGIIRWPGQTQPGATSDIPVINRDLYTTLLAVTGIPLPKDRIIDGADLRPALNNQPVQRTLPLFWNYQARAAIRKDDLKLILSANGSVELYDLKADPGESKDLAKAQPDIAAEMKLELEHLTAKAKMDAPQWPKREKPKAK